MAKRDAMVKPFWRAVIGVSAVFVLMGAKAEGCGGGEPGNSSGTGGNPEPPPPTICGPGEHPELVCEPGCGFDEGVPVDPGMPGFPGDPGDPGSWGGPDEPPPVSTGSGMVPPGPHPEECYEICVPDSFCPPGTYEEWVCEGTGMGPGEPCLDPNGCPEPPVEPGEECYPVCVPENVCGPGFHEDLVCSDPMPGPCLDPNGCPPEPGECVPTCVPDEDECPPGTHLDFFCDETGCSEICWGDEEPCPPGLIPEVQCDQYGCFEICIDPMQEYP
ncbi:MAG: hypothetical protein R3B72_46485 [Polyangiaceae bacterium]